MMIQKGFLFDLVSVFSEAENQFSYLHILSLFSGPFLACIESSFFFLIPTESVLENAEKWYVFQCLLLLTSFPLLCLVVLIIAEFMANFTIEKKFITFMFLIIICNGTYVIGTIIYYFIWTNIFEFAPPMPFSYYVTGSISFLGMSITLWFR